MSGLLTKNEIKLRAEIAEREAEIKRIRGNRIWTCPKCNFRAPIKNLYIIHEYFYVSPYSCAGGDYWTLGDNPEYQVYCPNCAHNARYFNCHRNHDLYSLVREYADDFGGEIHDYRDSRNSSYKIIRRLADTDYEIYKKLHRYLPVNNEFKDLQIPWINAV